MINPLVARFRLPRRPRLQYGLRSLLLVMLVVCVAQGWYVERVRRQRQAVAALTLAGADVDYTSSDDPFADERQTPRTCGEWLEFHTPRRLRDALGTDFFLRVAAVSFHEGDDVSAAVGQLRALPGIRYLYLDRVLDEDLAQIAALDSLTVFRSRYCEVTDAGLMYLAGLTRLEFLDLPGAEITDAGAVRLRHLRRLEYLDLNSTHVGDAGLAALADKLELEYLNLRYTDITDHGLVQLSGLRRLKHLDLSFTATGNAGLAVLTNMPELESLDLSDTLVTDEGLAPLRSLPALKELRLATTAITDQAVDVLGDLASLKELDINSTVVTPEGAARLESRLPHTIVTFTDHGEFAADSVARSHIERLKAARRWSDALRAIRQFHSSDLDLPEVLFEFARCHVGLAQWDKAESEYRDALERLARDPSQQHWYADRPWHELSAWPPLFERVAKARPNDFWRWMASARRAVLAAQWSAAARDYARAAECRRATVFTRGRRSTLANCEFEYALSRLLEGDVAEQRRVSAQLFETDRRVVEEEGETTWFRDNWKSATHLFFVAPQGTVGSSQIADWLKDDASSWWKTYELQPLIFCRAAMFNATLERKPPDDDEHVGRYWFARAMAHHHLGQASDARRCLARGSRWLDRRMRADRVSGYYNDASLLLEAEVLRREAQRLIMFLSATVL